MCFVLSINVCFAGDGKIDIRGRITSKSSTPGAKNLGTVRIEGKRESDTEYDKAVVCVKSTTKISSVKSLQIDAFQKLKEGMLVEVEFTGPVMESYPVQATAESICVLKAK